MVSFQCDGCADTVKKPQLDKHKQRCWSSFTCLDCSTTFQGTDYKSHTSCISEAEKYQGALYKGPKKNGGHAGNQQNNNGKGNNRFQPYPTSKPESSIPAPDSSANPPPATASAPQAAVEDTPAPAIAPPAPMVHPSRAKLVSTPSASPSNTNISNTNNRKSYQRGGAPPNSANAFPSLHPPSNYSPREPLPPASNGYRGGPTQTNGRKQGNQRGPNRKELTGMNMLSSSSGMRSWGATPTASAEGSVTGGEGGVGGDASGIGGDADGEEGAGKKNKKKKVKKGDKGGTGSRAGISSKVNGSALKEKVDPAPATSEQQSAESETTTTAAPPPTAAPTSAPTPESTTTAVPAPVIESAPLPLGVFFDTRKGTGHVSSKIQKNALLAAKAANKAPSAKAIRKAESRQAVALANAEKTGKKIKVYPEVRYDEVTGKVLKNKEKYKPKNPVYDEDGKIVKKKKKVKKEVPVVDNTPIVPAHTIPTVFTAGGVDSSSKLGTTELPKQHLEAHAILLAKLGEKAKEVVETKKAEEQALKAGIPKKKMGKQAKREQIERLAREKIEAEDAMKERAKSKKRKVDDVDGSGEGEANGEGKGEGERKIKKMKKEKKEKVDKKGKKIPKGEVRKGDAKKEKKAKKAAEAAAAAAAPSAPVTAA